MNRLLIRSAIVAAAAILGTGLVASAANKPPTLQELSGKDGTPRVVLLLRVVTEVDGEIVEPFRHSGSIDNINFGLSGFETGMGVKEIATRYLSGESRKEGWVSLIVKPGLQYVAIREPMWHNAFVYNARWKTCPRWRIEIPAGSQVHYAGTFFLPGRGRFMFSGPRQMVEFDTTRLEVRDESLRAAEICRQLMPEFAPPTVRLAELHKAGDTMIIETPAGK